MWLLYLLLIFPNPLWSLDLLPSSVPNVCAVRPSTCNLLCPYGYLRDVLQQCVCTCAMDPCQTTVCAPTESCIAVGVKARCIPKFGSNREECPRLTGGVCALRCEKDGDCSGRLICCSNGCGRECVAPISKSFPISSELPIQPVSSSSSSSSSIPIHGSFQRLIHAVSNIASTHFNSTPIPPTIRNLANTLFPTSPPIRPQLQTTKVGQCPSPTGNLSICTNQKKCANDMDCGSVDKCCPNECGSTCMEPLKATGCIHMVLAISKLKDKRLPNEFVPFCERNGRFSSIQCDIQFCWCVDVHYGSEIAGTRISREQRRMDMCQERRLCSQKCHNQCTHGHVMDLFGCPLPSCTCVDICKNVKCENRWETCQLVEPDCANPPCLPVPRCLLNPCRYGPPSRLSNGITALCSSDKDCSESICFKIGYNGLGFCCAGPEASTREGRCPSQSADKLKCVLYPENACRSDHECSDDDKCCFNGCTLSCTPPEGYSMKKTTVAPPMHYQPGDVEKYNKGHLSSLVADCADIIATNVSCSTECHSDSQCLGMKRCCRQGCSTTCMYPVRSTPCFHLTLTAELYSLRNAMKCDRAGNFEQFQCDDEGCFCVDIATGDELPGSRAIGKKPNCESPNPCEPLVCKVACPYGFERGSNSCPTCKCRNPCEEVKCPQGSVCVMSSVLCYQTGNCVPQPRCVLNFCPTGDPFVSGIGNVESCSKDEECPSETHWCHKLGLSSGGVCCPSPARVRHAGTCPTVPISLDAKMCRVSCKVDDDCNGHQKCCFDGCGAACRDITTPLVEISKEILEKAGTCISEQRVLCNRLEKNTCEYDTDCAGVAKCCDDGCVKACAYPLQTSKCLVRKTNLQKMGQMDLIKCRPDGSFEQIQCDVEYCWCVDEEGNYVEGTRTGEDITPTCPEPCAKLECGPIGCEYGHKKDKRGCSTCDCVDPCDGVTCPSDSICTPTSVPCVTKPCPTIPRCVINPCPISEVVRNETTLHLKKCFRSNDCFDTMMTTHCSMLTQNTGFCCTGEQPEIHSGVCPKITELNAAKVEKCVQECKTDSDCNQNSKCCWNGCGLTCVTASMNRVTTVLQTAPGSHPGECLNVAPLGAFCLQRPTIADCKNDDDCPSLYKCCSDGCVMRCTQPNKAPLCVHQRIAALSMTEGETDSNSNENEAGVFVPDCDSLGNFDEVQSHFGLMWCVDPKGQEIPGTKSIKVPNCDTPRACPNRNCDKKCPYGFRSDNEGCRVCDCIDPCEFVNCPAGNVCRLVPVKCTTQECRPIAKCIPNMCGAGEPLALEHSLLATCSATSSCPAGYHCKNSGYTDISFCCSTPELSQQSLRCPVIPLMIASVDGSSCVVGCRHHYDCSHSSCCFNGCGMSCQFETRQAAIKPIKTFAKNPAKITTTRRPIMSSLKIEKKASKIQNVIVEHHAILPVSPVQSVAKLGTCPKLLINPGCAEQCSQDSECHGFLKCCTASCGTMCSAPRIATACIHRLIAFETKISTEIVNLIIPPVQCTAEGLFRRYQCDARINQCWCVDVATGVELIGTRMFSIGLHPPDCDNPKTCSIQCSESVCPYGVKTDGSGCPANGKCECNNICSSFICPLNKECALRRVECTSNPCPDVPFCVEVQCPIPQRDLYRNVILCDTDGGCGKNSKCVIDSATELGVCCHFKHTQSSVLNLIAPAIVAAAPDDVSVTTTDPPKGPMIVEAIPMSLSTNCTTMRIALEYIHQNGAILKSPLPRCAKNGNYERTQCDNKRCWCVDEFSGEEVHGTRKKKTKNACKSQSMCLSKCSATLCPYGLLLDGAGCPRPECICKSACEHVDCPNGQVCILRRAECPNKWCLPVPTCEKSPCNSGLRPLVETRTRQQYSCTQNTVCPIGYYCTAFDENMHGVCCPGIESIKSIGGSDGMTCPHGDPFSSLSDGSPLSCTVLTNGCPATHYCSTMPGRSSGICCVSKRYVCNLQRDAGPCSATVSRYFYSSLAHTCAPFDYGGCSGNLNNFATRDDCENFCAGIGLDLSSPYDHASAQMPTESYQLAFSLTGGKIPESKMQDAEIQLINMLVGRFGIPRGSIEDVMIKENGVKFTIRDVDARRFAREVSEKVSTGELTMTLAGQKVTAEPHTLTALHVSNEHSSRNTAKVVLYAILLAASIFVLCVICLLCFSCFCYYRNQPKDRATTPSNTTSATESRAGRQSELRRVFSRDDVSVCSDFNRPPMHDVSILNRDRHSRPPALPSSSHTRHRSQSWLSLG